MWSYRMARAPDCSMPAIEGGPSRSSAGIQLFTLYNLFSRFVRDVMNLAAIR